MQSREVEVPGRYTYSQKIITGYIVQGRGSAWEDTIIARESL
jgi:hypothetical protein